MLKRLQFGTDQLRVPGHTTDLQLVNYGTAPIDEKLVDNLVDPNSSHLWDLIFSYVAPNFFLSTDSVPGLDGTVVESWYSLEGGNGGPHALSVTPFVVDENGSGTFAQVHNFVDFDAPATTENSVNTDTIAAQSVTATVHQSLPEFSNLTISTRATNASLIITSTTTQATFDRLFVYSGNGTVNSDSLTVAKGVSSNALAVFKKTTTTSTSETSTLQYPKIPKWEWQMIVVEIMKRVTAKGAGEIYEYLSPDAITTLGSEAAKSAIEGINKKIENLGKVKVAISSLSKRTVG